MEQKHTPYYYVDTQLGDRYCIMDGNDMSKDGAYRMLEEIKKVSALTKENEQYKAAIKSRNILQEEDKAKIKALTEQVEKLKFEYQKLYDTYSEHDRKLNEANKEYTDLAIKFEDKNFELSRLREERKELISLLTRIHDNRTLSYKTLSDNHYREIKSLLSKFEVPNQS